MQVSGAWNLKNYAIEAPQLNYRVALVPRPAPVGESTRASPERRCSSSTRNRCEKRTPSRSGVSSRATRRRRSSHSKCKACFRGKRTVEDEAFIGDERVRVFVEQALTSQTAPPHPGWVDMEDIINRSVEEVMYGRAEPREALSAAAEEMRAVVSGSNEGSPIRERVVRAGLSDPALHFARLPPRVARMGPRPRAACEHGRAIRDRTAAGDPRSFSRKGPRRSSATPVARERMIV